MARHLQSVVQLHSALLHPWHRTIRARRKQVRISKTWQKMIRTRPIQSASVAAVAAVVAVAVRTKVRLLKTRMVSKTPKGSNILRAQHFRVHRLPTWNPA